MKIYLRTLLRFSCLNQKMLHTEESQRRKLRKAFVLMGTMEQDQKATPAKERRSRSKRLEHPGALETWEHAVWPPYGQRTRVHIDFHEKLGKDLWRAARVADVFNCFTGAVGYFYPAVILEPTGRSKLGSLSEMITFQEKICEKD